MKRPRSIGHRLNLVERAYFARQWKDEAVTAQIQALIGGDPAMLVNSAGRVLYVALGAAMAQGIEQDAPEIRIIRGAVNAAHDQVGQDEIPVDRRASIVSGLEAVDRLMPRLERTNLINSAINLDLMLSRKDGVRHSDFEALLQLPKRKATA